MTLTGNHLIGTDQDSICSDSFHVINPATGKALPPMFREATLMEVDQAVKLADEAFAIYRFTTIEQRSRFLNQIAGEIDRLGQVLVDRATAETALPEARISAEIKRTTGQLRLFADTLQKGHYLDIRIDNAIADRKPMAKPDIRTMNIPIGPVAVFGACNFPLAFSVAGGDTASALAAGCPVVVKAHPAHPGTSELVGRAIAKAVQSCHLPERTFSLLQGKKNQVGQALVQHPRIKAVGFTGSFSGGKALFDLAASRPEPIPFFAEMGSVNPVFILPSALEDNVEKISQGLVASITQGVGQFCTSPGIVFLIKNKMSDVFIDLVKSGISQISSQQMLHKGIQENYYQGLSRLNTIEGVESLTEQNISQPDGCEAVAMVFKTDSKTWMMNKFLSMEIFGPSSLLVMCDSENDLLDVANNFKGELTASIHARESDYDCCQKLINHLQKKVGRIIFNGFPTGVEVCDSMIHGGPFPATTDGRFTSVGTAAIKRFLRPVAFQDIPQSLLPDVLKDCSDFNLMKLVDGKYKT